ncbi:CFA74 protein, partial [Pitta sordida]|nr:CFA74 protein [Pitta sordida]
RNLKLLDDVAKEKELVAQRTRQQLSACRLRIRMLAEQLDRVDMEIEREEEAGNVAALSRLQAVSSRLCSELEREKELELIVAVKLKHNLLEVWQIETEQGRHELLCEGLEEAEEELQLRRQERGKTRVWKEKVRALQAEGRRRSGERKEEKTQKEYEEQRQKLLEDAKKNHERAVSFLRQSTARIHEKIAKEEAQSQEHMERRIQAVLSLKSSITSNREKLQTFQVLTKAKALEAEKEEMRMKEAILAEGGNVVKEIFIQKRQLKHEKEKQAFRERQKARKIEIVSRILQEKASAHKQKKSQSHLKAMKARDPLRSGLLLNNCSRIIFSCFSQQSFHSPSPCSLAGERSAPGGDRCGSTPRGEDRDKTLLEPEFPGLWGQQYHLHKVPREEVDPTQLAIRAVRKHMSEGKAEEFQNGAFPKQTVPGGEHRGCAFHSKPSCIHFKDFDVGQIYKKKIVLTNASSSVNSCRLVGLSEGLEDFISVHFVPPGKMPSGMSCEFVVTFKPVINKGVEGEVLFLAHTGAFSVPLKCTVKSCVLALDKELLDFGSLVVGETISRPISLTNSGALGARFR